VNNASSQQLELTGGKPNR